MSSAPRPSNQAQATIEPQRRRLCRYNLCVAVMSSGTYDLARFLAAQHAVIDTVYAELADGSKRTHWMWFIFPQLRGLGSSPTAERFAIGSLAEARAYLQHPLLGARLRHCTALVNAVAGRSAQQIFGAPDCLKFHSCMTLFAHADEAAALFRAALAKYYGGLEDPRTRELLAAPARNTNAPPRD